MKKFYINTGLLVTAVMFTFGMVFGIGFKHTNAVTPTQTGATVQTHVTETAASEEHATTGEHAENTEEDQGVVGLLGLNGKLFIAQLINFAIVLFVLWKWVFGPVAKGLSNRTAKIEASLADAEKIAEDRKNFDSWKDGEISEVRKEAAAILTKAKSEAENLKVETLTQTKEEQAKITAQATAQIEQQKQAMVKEAKAEIADLVISATQAVIKVKLDPKKDKELVEQALSDAGGKHEV